MKPFNPHRSIKTVHIEIIYVHEEEEEVEAEISFAFRTLGQTQNSKPETPDSEFSQEGISSAWPYTLNPEPYPLINEL